MGREMAEKELSINRIVRCSMKNGCLWADDCDSAFRRRLRRIALAGWLRDARLSEMLRQSILSLVLCLSPLAAQAQNISPSSPAAPEAAPIDAEVEVKLQTSAGPIIIALDTAHAPITSANFLRYVDEKRLDGIGFYRAMRMSDTLGLIQAGTGNDPKRTLPPIAHEPTSQTGLSHVEGTISMARYAPGSAAGDFFITIGAMPSLDAHPEQEGDNLGFAAFGRVIAGMDVVKQILEAPIAPDKGEGALKGQMIAAPVKIISAQRLSKR